MPKVTIIGAGSAFTSRLCADILHIPDLAGGEIALVDLDAGRLDLARQMIEKIVAAMDKPWTVAATTDRTQALPDTDYVINCIEVSGLDTIRHDYEIPLKYGVKQCIGDTIGPGGVFKGLRTIPVWIEILEDIERLAPDALVLNYTNPMSMMMLAATWVSALQMVGLCHSVQGTSHQLAEYADVPYEEMIYRCGGINHMSWFTELSHHDDDLYPVLRARCQIPEVYEKDPVRFDMMIHLGYFVTESSGHFSEYVPYYRKRDDLIEKYCREGFLGETGFYPRIWPQWRRECDENIRKTLSGEKPLDLKRSHEYASVIIEAAETNRPAVIYGTVPNAGLIDNLSLSGVVEVPCLIDRTGITPCRFGVLPPQCAALCASNMAVYELAALAALDRDREAAIHAIMLDPLTAAVCSPSEILQMVEEMFEAEQEYLPGF